MTVIALRNGFERCSLSGGHTYANDVVEALIVWKDRPASTLALSAAGHLLTFASAARNLPNSS